MHEISTEKYVVVNSNEMVINALVGVKIRYRLLGQHCSPGTSDLTGKQADGEQRSEAGTAEERWQPRQWLSFREHSLFLEQTGMPLSISYIQ